MFSCAINEFARFENRDLGARLAVRTHFFCFIRLRWENSKTTGLQTLSLQLSNIKSHGGKKELLPHTSARQPFDGYGKSVQIANRGPFLELK